MPGKHNAGGCGCCDVCPQCTNITYLIISGLTSGGYCTGGCEDRNGTYVFRAPGDPIPGRPSGGGCLWIISPYTGNNCGHTCELGQTEHWYIGGNGAGCCNGYWSFSVQLIPLAGGAVRLKVTGIIDYCKTVDIDCTGYGAPTKYYYSSYSAVWQKDFADCASIGGTLPLYSTDQSDACDPPDPGLTGDLCGLQGATVEVG